ncbi:MAG: hypothetical protein LAT64_00815 [Phycisphaerales bacterium]|nr:hypothetical protein [Planctomycetota bacterium]MCH8507303.1 hypothetical protein [Phycisphaerales bacterium]
MQTRWNSITDARGKRWRYCQIREASKASRIDPSLLAPRACRASGMQSIRIGLLTGLAYGSLMSLYLTVSFSSGTIHFRYGWFDLAMLLSMFIIFGLTMTIMTCHMAWRSPEHARDALLEYDLCPVCVHGLGGIPPEPDGCVVCPECGAAWRMFKAPDRRDASQESVSDGS